MNARRKSPSIREIADKIGISKSAVALALNKPVDDCPLAPATREKIQKAAAEMGYRTNSMARTMRTGKFNTVSLMIGNTHPLYLPIDLVHGIEDTLEQHSYRLNLTWLTERKLAESEYVPNVLEEWSCDGLIVHCPGSLPENIETLISRHRIPSVHTNDKMKSDCVHPDDFGGAYAATRRLIELGHREIGYLHFFKFDHYSEVDRYEGYRTAMEEAGLPPDKMIETPGGTPLAKIDRDYRFELASEILQRPERPSAILCYEIEVAAPVLTVAMQMGISVPEDLSLVTFGRFNRNDTGRSMSTVQLNMEQVGCRAADMMLEKIKNPGKRFDPVAVPLVIDNESTMVPPAR